MPDKKRIILAITGASGAIYGLRTLQALKTLGIETHLVISPVGAQVIAQETHVSLEEVHGLADHVYQPDQLGARIASGSFQTDGMLVVPCSIKTLSGIANAYTENLVQRAADVCLKEGHPLLLGVRETPLHIGHLRLMENAAQSGAIIYPLSPAFYHQPQTIDALVNATVGRMLARIGIENHLYQPWDGKSPS
jgi:4-hydroxy-3-polyprenylbenzoate decarboxylase